MQLGDFEIPEVKFENCLELLSQTYEVKHREKIPSKELAILWGFKYGSEGHYYRKLKALQLYKMIEGKGVFTITDIGELLIHPKNNDEKEESMADSILGVPLWMKIHEAYGKLPPEDNFWAILMSVTQDTPDQCKNLAKKILIKYKNDVNKIEFLREAKMPEVYEPEPTKKITFDLNKNNVGAITIKDIGDIELTDIESVELGIHALQNLRKKLQQTDVKNTSELKTIL